MKKQIGSKFTANFKNFLLFFGAVRASCPGMGAFTAIFGTADTLFPFFLCDNDIRHCSAQNQCEYGTCNNINPHFRALLLKKLLFYLTYFKLFSAFVFLFSLKI